MKKSLNLSIIATVVIAAFSCQSAFAVTVQSDRTELAIDSNKVIELKDGSKVREMTNNQRRSLYQIALLSDISITELRQMNAGRYDKKDIVEVGERLVLPENSPLLPDLVKADNAKEDKYQNLPKLGSDEHYDVKSNKDQSATQVASVLQTLGSQDWKQLTSADNGGLSGHLKTQGQDYAESYVRNGVKSQLVDPLRNTAQDFLGRFGTAQLQFDLSDKGDLSNVNVKLFSPWYDSDSTLVFSQLTFQEYEKNRRIGNFGIGQRWDVGDNEWLLGYNVFFDHDFQRSHNRLGLGLEAWTDYMKFAANYYYPLSDWKSSRDFDDYLERAAKGFDIRFQGYLPQYPHLGGSLMYEQYFGDKVALFGKDNLQKDPHAVTVGLDYTPVPLFTIKGEHKLGQDSKKTTKAELTMNYRIGTPLKDQLDPDMVQAARSLKGSRYDLVDRNNYIVLEYKEKKMSVDLGLPTLQLVEGQSYDFSMGLHNAKGVSKLAWIGDTALIDANGGFLCFTTGTCNKSSWQSPEADTNNWHLTAPAYANSDGVRLPIRGSNSISDGKYTVAVTVTDSRGKSATSNQVTFEVLPSSDLRRVELTPNNLINPVGQTIAIVGRLVDNKGQGIKDNSVFAPESKDESQLTDDDLKQINRIWSATVPFALEAKGCPVDSPKGCLFVKGIKKNSDASGDSYELLVSTKNRLGSVQFTLQLEDHDGNKRYEPAKSTIIFNGELADRLEIYNSAGELVGISDSSNSSKQVWAEKIQLGQSYYAVARDKSGAPVINMDYTWALVTDSKEDSVIKDCKTIKAPTEFTESNKVGYKLTKGPFVSDQSDYPTMYTPKGINGSEIEGACAGDQGFKLQVTAVHNPNLPKQ